MITKTGTPCPRCASCVTVDLGGDPLRASVKCCGCEHIWRVRR